MAGFLVGFWSTSHYESSIILTGPGSMPSADLVNNAIDIANLYTVFLAPSTMEDMSKSLPSTRSIEHLDYIV